MAHPSPEPTLRSTNGWTSVSLRLIELSGEAGAYVSLRVRSKMWRPPGVEELDVVRDFTHRVAMLRTPMEEWEAMVRRACELSPEEPELQLGSPGYGIVTFRLSGSDAIGHTRVAMVIEVAAVRSSIEFSTDVTCLGTFATELGQWNARLRAMGVL